LTVAIAGTAAIPVLAQNDNSNNNTNPSGTASPVTSFSVERVISTQNMFSTMTPTFPQQFAGSIQNGSLEARQSIAFDPSSNMLTITGFVVQPGSPNPTPAGSNFAFNTFSQVQMKVDRVYVTDKPRPAIMFVGTLANSSVTDPFGNLAGAPAAVSIGLKDETTNSNNANVNTSSINNVVVLIAGTNVTYSAAGAGAVTLPNQQQPSQPGQPGQPGSAGPTIILNGTTLDTPYKQVTLSAVDTRDPQGLPITFEWKVLTGSATFVTPSAAETVAQLQGGKGQYMFQVTATNSRGAQSTANVIVNFF
jgi:hypothetical protein